MISENTAFEADFDNILTTGEDVPSLNHAKLQSRIATELTLQYGENYDVVTEISLDLPQGGAEPDVAIFSLSEDDWFNDIVKLKELPLVAIEILSPKQALSDLTDKIASTYLASGVQSVWLVIPTFKQINVITGKNQMTTFLSGKVVDTVSGFELDMESVFKRRHHVSK